MPILPQSSPSYMSSNFSYWELSSFLSGYDVMIIGSGLAGLSATLHLKQSNSLLKIGALEAGFCLAEPALKTPDLPVLQVFLKLWMN